PHVAETAPNYSFAQLPPINFKGIEKPMMPFLLLGRVGLQSGPSDQNIILGRIMERGILTMKLVELTAPRQSEPAGILLIEGEAGIGKSRIVANFMEQANQKGVRVLYGEADPVESGTPYYAFRSILESIFNITGWKDPQTMRENVLLAMAEDQFLLDRAPLLREILPLHWPDNELTSQMSGESRATSIKEVVLHILRRSLIENQREVPTVIILDDAQWLDSATWNLIGHINRELPSILLIVAMRPFQENEIGTQIEEEYQRVRTNPATQYLPLTSLSLGDTAHLVAQRLRIKALPLFVLEFIRLRSQGNPFLTEQVAYALRDAGIIHIDGGDAVIDFAADELNRIDFPATVEGIITSRIDRLSPSQQLTLKVASVIGRVFLLKILESVHPNKISTSVLNEQLNLLTRLGITDLEAPTPELTYFFKHVITQEVIYNLLTFAQRKQLHCAIAEWYENNYFEDPSPYYSRLAHHWLKGEVIEKAIYFLDKAGEQALQLYANEDVIRFVSTAVELDQRTYGNTMDAKANPQRILRRAHWERMLGLAHINMGHLPEALQHYREGLKLLGYPMPATNGMITMSLIKELLIQVSHRIYKYQRQNRGRSLDRQKKEELARIDIEGAVYYSQNVALLAWAMLRRLNLAEQLGMPVRMAEGYSNLLMIASFAHNQGLINLYRKLAWEAVEQANRTSTRLYALLRDGVALFVSCEWERAGERFSTGMKLAEQLGDSRHLADHTASYATSLFLQGKYKESLQLWSNLYQKVVRTDAPQSLTWSLYGQGHNLLMLGQMEDAILDLEASLTILMKSAEDKILNTSLYGALSLVYLRKGQFDRALENAVAHQKNATPPSASSIMSYYSAILDALLGLYEGFISGNIQLSDVETVQLKQLVGRIPKSLNTMKNLPANQAGVWLYKGIYDNLSGKQKAASADWTKSLEYAERFNQPYELGRASYELGRHLSADARSRREYLERACAVFERLGTTYELNLTKAALQELTSA
ncbi:MAG TPA: AAA family ATPase, partial [Anaerolineales bacterium]|nr:AAA family ATPase [Anaerolineales bacterium]